MSIFKRTCSRKSTGPDGISATLLKVCAEELAPVWLFQKSVDSHTVSMGEKNCYRALKKCLVSVNLSVLSVFVRLSVEVMGW